MVFKSTAAFHHLLSYMVHPTKSLTSVGLALIKKCVNTQVNICEQQLGTIDCFVE